MSRSRLFERDGSADVTCIACGETTSRDDAREYDKYGDRYTRDGKTFEYLCKPCYREYAHYPRDGLESTLIDAGAGEVSRDEFLCRYVESAAADSHTADE